MVGRRRARRRTGAGQGLDTLAPGRWRSAWYSATVQEPLEAVVKRVVTGAGGDHPPGVGRHRQGARIPKGTPEWAKVPARPGTVYTACPTVVLVATGIDGTGGARGVRNNGPSGAVAGPRDRRGSGRSGAWGRVGSRGPMPMSWLRITRAGTSNRHMDWVFSAAGQFTASPA